MGSNSDQYLREWLVLAASTVSVGRVKKALEEGYSPSEIVDLKDGVEEILCLSSGMKRSLTSCRNSVNPEKTVKQLEGTGTEIIVYSDESYPAGLKNIWDPPLVLFVKGTLLEKERNAAIVGSRKCAAYGLKMTKMISSQLAHAGVCVVSGLARGIDYQAHVSALENGGRTIAVLGSGMLNIHPKNHRGLAERISSNGAVITEFMPDVLPRPYNFPRRNRIISGISECVTVVSAEMKSGSAITAGFALEQGKDVLAVPGRVDDPLAQGCLRLIADGANLAMSGESVLQVMGIDLEKTKVAGEQLSFASGVTTGNSNGKNDDLSSLEQYVYTMVASESMNADELQQRSGKEPGEIATAITGLFMRRLIFQEAGGRWCADGRSISGKH